MACPLFVYCVNGDYQFMELNIPGDSEPPFRRHSTAVPF